MDTWRSEDQDANDGDVIEIIPVEDYDSKKAKLRASLSWVLGKAFEDKVPEEFQDPFYERGEGKWQLKPRLMNLMTTSDLYCQACKTMFGESASQWQGHWSIIQVLSRKGIYAVGSDDVDVTETILMQTAPFKMAAHLALIDALMTAFTREVITIERVTQSVRRFATFNASSELPSDTEDAILFWVNKVCVSVQRLIEKQDSEDQLIEGGETSQKVRILSRQTPRDSTSVPLMESVLRDIGDGCSLATLLSFYCPELLRLEDICLKSNVGIADSLYNLRLVRTFCDKHMPQKCFHMTFEDLLYTHETMKENFFVLFAELFYWFEIKRIAIVTGGGFPSTAELDHDSRPGTAKQLTAGKLPNIPISNVTKQSFHRVHGDSELRSSSHPDLHRQSPSTPVAPRMPLLHKRHQLGHGHFDDSSLPQNGTRNGVRRTNSLTSRDIGNNGQRQSVLAWQEKSPPGVHGTDLLQPASASQASGNLLANVSIDSDMNASFSSTSIDLGDLDNSPRPDTDRQLSGRKGVDENTIHYSLQSHPPQEEFLELESVQSGGPSRVSNAEEFHTMGDNLEPLMPARLKPAKEKSSNYTKEEERGDLMPRKKTSSPPKFKKSSDTVGEVIDRDRSDSSVSDDRVTPLPDDQLSARDYQTPGVPYSNPNDTNQELDPLSDKKYEAFFIRGSLGDSQQISTHRTDVSDKSIAKESYTMSEQFQTPEAARAAGIPVIGESSDTITTPFGRLSREGSVASSRSSGDFSDHESRKIHHDHKTREFTDTRKSKQMILSNHSDLSDPSDFIIQKPVIITKMPQESKAERALSTNFAQIKRMKELGNVDNSGMVYMQHGREDDQKKNSLRDAFQKNKAEKRTTFAPLPNQTTWHQSASTSNHNQESATGSGENSTASSELVKIRLKLEEKRKVIERKKRTEEIQLQKMRQRLGKAAFLHVVSNPNKQETVSRDAESAPSTSQVTVQPARMTTSDPELPVASASTATASKPQRQSPLQSPTRQRVPHTFSRDNIQQTIENVRKRWFKEDDLVAPKMAEQEDSREATASSLRSNASAAEARETDESGEPVEKQESYEEYNSSLDRLNQSLTDLQGEIMRLSLKQKQPSATKQKQSDVMSTSSTSVNSESPVRSRSRSRSPPHVLDVAKKTLPDSAMESVPEAKRLTGPVHAQVRSSSEPRQIISDQRIEQGDQGYQSSTLPRPGTFQANQVPPFMMHGNVTVAGPTGPVYSGPNQFVPVPAASSVPPTAQQYGSYIMGPSPPQQMGPIPQPMGMSPYQHSPPQMYPANSMYSQPYPPHPPHMISSPPQTQPYPGAMYPSPPQTHFQPVQQFGTTHTVHSHHSQLPSSAQLYQQPENQLQSNVTQTQQEPEKIPSSTATQYRPEAPKDIEKATTSAAQCQSMPASQRGPDTSMNGSTSDQSKNDSQFSLTTQENSPRRQKSQINDSHADISATPSILSDFTREDDSKEQDSLMLDQTNLNQSEGAASNVGFVIGQDESSLNESAEFEMQKKKEKILQMRLKRQEEQERKRVEKEQEQARKKEAERLKQEEAERRKSEEKARREMIFKQYLEKKEEEEEGTKKKKKSRPKSMFAKSGAAGGDQGEGLESYSSSEDLNARAFTISAGNSNANASKGHRINRQAPPPSRTMRKAVSCNQLTQNQNGTNQADKNLAFGGLTHRRPPSPDLYRLRKGNRSNESSEAGSATGADYTGPKLFVKPSAKSNRHIIINAISHCCLAGCVNTDLKNKVLEEIAKSDAKHFIILFRDASCGYRGLYSFDPDSEDVQKIMGVGPRQISNKMVEKYFKYNSGAKSFTEVKSTKHVSVSIDAVALQNSVWKTNKPPPKGYR